MERNNRRRGPDHVRMMAFAASVALAAIAVLPAAWAHALSPHCQANGGSPDVIVGDIYDKVRHGAVGDITAFSIGTKSCNTGTCQLNWISSTNDHPVIGQNMYRLKDGRFEQIGQSWLKHGYTALQQSLCGTCQSSGSGSYLGVNCADPYSASLNGSQSRLGPKFEVNPFSGDFPYPPTNGNLTGNAIYKRLQVKNSDLDPALNPGSQYFVEAQYVSWDDSYTGMNKNNASYRPITVSGSAGTYDIALSGSTLRETPAIRAWAAADATVVLSDVSVPNDGLILLGAKVTQVGGTWRYEYAVQNVSMHRAIGWFAVPIPVGAAVTNISFHDVDYHSGEPIVGTDWPGLVQDGRIYWASETQAQNPNANSLRWGTLYNFRFELNVPPTTGAVALGPWRPGAPTEFSASTLVPTLCDGDGYCEAGETCSSCAADCANQGGGSGCCGNASCELGENPCRCPADCGAPTTGETACANGIDDDCDALLDCADFDCCTAAACASGDADEDGWAALCDCDDTNPAVRPQAAQLCDGVNNNCSDPSWPAVPANEADADGDGVRICGEDCDDANPQVWAAPGEARELKLTHDLATGATGLIWQAPLVTGGSATHYDTLRSIDMSDFLGSSTCLQTNDPMTVAVDSDVPPGPGVWAYLVRAVNACPNGTGSLGVDSSGIPRQGRACP